jgi:hypothetical protein
MHPFSEIENLLHSKCFTRFLLPPGMPQAFGRLFGVPEKAFKQVLGMFLVCRQPVPNIRETSCAN